MKPKKFFNLLGFFLLAGAAVLSACGLLSSNAEANRSIPTSEPISEERPLLIVGGDQNYPPYCYLENGEPAGFDVDLMRAVAELEGYDLEFRLGPWNEVREALDNGEIDVIPGMFYTPQRDAAFDFSITTALVSHDLFVRSGTQVNALEDMRGKAIIVQQGDVMHDYLLESGLTDRIILAADPEEALQMLASGEGDAVLISSMQGRYFIQRDSIRGIVPAGLELSPLEYRFAVREGNQELLYRLNDGLAQLKSSGEYLAIYDRHFDASEPTNLLYALRYLIAGLIIGGLVILAFIIWNRLLHREVRHRVAEVEAGEERYRLLVENANECITVVCGDIFVFANPRAEVVTGYSQEEFKNLHLKDFVHPDDFKMVWERYQRRLQGEEVTSEYLYRIITRQGQTRWMIVHAVKISWNGQPAALLLYTDITDLHAAEEELRASENRFKQMFMDSPLGYQALNEEGIILDINPAWLALTGYEREDALGKSFIDLVSEEDRDRMKAQCKLVKAGHDIHQVQLQLMRKDGEPRIVSISGQLSRLNVANARQINCILTDITEQTKALETIRSLALFSDQNPNPVLRVDLQGTIMYANSSSARLLKHWQTGIGEVLPERWQKIIQTAAANDEDELAEEACGNQVYDVFVTPILDRGYVNIYASDVTDRERVETALRHSEEKFARAFHISPDSISITRITDGAFLEVNKGFTDLSGYQSEDVAGKSSVDIDLWVNDEDRVELMREIHERGEVIGMEALFRRKDGAVRTGLLSARVLIVSGEPCLICITRDITERKQAEERGRAQLQRLAALRMVDIAITANIDLSSTLRVVVEQAVTQLNVDAAAIYLLDSGMQMLELVAQIGIQKFSEHATHLHLAEGLAGQVAMDRMPRFYSNLAEENSERLLTTDFLQEGLKSYYGWPLVAKGMVVGVLEVFWRREMTLEGDWINFLETLAGQAAIAIDNSSLFNGLQRSNAELTMAYDATIEGWARALELRDGETEGHSQRVTQLTLDLARLMGIRGKDLINLRRGSFLHDIGKMGIPDSILLKPGPLTEEEWVVMRRHPELAYKFLSSVEFLRSALDIPFCHHEHWDGSGYPRGLKGEEIPLPARIFSVVDAWDALNSDRPYRKAWPRQKVRAYLAEQAGKLFDPRVVDFFINSFLDKGL